MKRNIFARLAALVIGMALAAALPFAAAAAEETPAPAGTEERGESIAGTGVAERGETDESAAGAGFDFGAYFRENIMPGISMVAAGLLTLYLTLSPLLARVKAALCHTNAAMDGIRTAADTWRGAEKETRATRESAARLCMVVEDRVAALVACQRAENTRADDRMAALEEEVRRLSRMVQIGFCNLPDLVKNGYAAAIARLLPSVVDDTVTPGDNAMRHAERTEGDAGTPASRGGGDKDNAAMVTKCNVEGDNQRGDGHAAL